MSTATVTAPSYRRPRTSARRPASAPVRLTRRGRIVVVLAVLALALVGFALIGSPAVSTDQTHHAASHTVVIRGGETLWDLAGRIAPDEDPRVVISDIVDLNNLSDAGSIRVGQELYVPTY